MVDRILTRIGKEFLESAEDLEGGTVSCASPRREVANGPAKAEGRAFFHFWFVILVR